MSETEVLEKYSALKQGDLEDVREHAVEANLTDLNFTPRLLNEMVLWKLNRYVSLDGINFAASTRCGS